MVAQHIESIAKLDAARRQLRTAVKLFFEYGDDVSIHTLVAAAHEVLADLLKRQGKRTRLAQLIDDQVKPANRGSVLKAFDRAWIFFKHGQHGEKMRLDFDPRQTHVLFINCGHAYFELTGGYLRELLCFGMWYDLEYPEVVTGAPPKAIADDGAPHRDRRAFLAWFNSRTWPKVD
jgi:hypothetical protein